MRSQVIVLGSIEREIYVQLATDLLPPGTKAAEEITHCITGSAVTIAERLSHLALSTAIITGIGTTDEDREVLSSLRKRGIQTRGIRSGARTTPTSVRVRTPRHQIRMTSAVSGNPPSKQAVLRALPGSRHFHICGSVLDDAPSLEMGATALARAKSLGATTSLDMNGFALTQTMLPDATVLLAHVDVLFADSETLRALADTPRIGAAAAAVLALGVSAIAARLGAGGSRVYTREDTIRIPRLGPEVPEVPEIEAAWSAFASGYLLGWLLGSKPEICGVFGASAALENAKQKLPDRRELSSRMAEARRNPHFRKLVPVLSDAQRVLDRARRLPRRDLAAATPRVSR